MTSDFQKLVDDTFRGTFEIHIFVAPLNASPEVKIIFYFYAKC